MACKRSGVRSPLAPPFLFVIILISKGKSWNSALSPINFTTHLHRQGRSSLPLRNSATGATRRILTNFLLFASTSAPPLSLHALPESAVQSTASVVLAVAASWLAQKAAWRALADKCSTCDPTCHVPSLFMAFASVSFALMNCLSSMTPRTARARAHHRQQFRIPRLRASTTCATPSPPCWFRAAPRWK